MRTSESQPVDVDPEPARGSRQLKFFAVLAAGLLLGTTGLVEFSLREHRARAFEALELESTRLVAEVAQTHSQALLDGDADALRAVARDMMRFSEIEFVRFGSPGAEALLTVGRGESDWSTGPSAALRPDRTSSRLVRGRAGRVLEVVVPLRSVAQQAAFDGASLAVGRDITRTEVALRSAATRVRIFQTAFSVVMLLGLWIAIQRVLGAAEGVELAAAPGTDRAERAVPEPGLSSATTEAPEEHAASSAASSDPGTASQPLARPVRLERRPLPSRDAASRDAHRVLVVEDNPVNRSLAVKMLETLGCSVVCAEDGLASLAAIEAEAFDLVLMDIQMPGMDGFEATRRIRAEEQRIGARPTPIVALTAHSQPPDRIASARAGMNDHIAKPFTQEDLGRAIEEWCDSVKDDG